MLITNRRTTFTTLSTIGKLTIDTDSFTCFVLEPPRDVPGPTGKICIPAGKYPLVMYFSPKHGYEVPLLQNIPGHDFVEMHIGNFPKDTLDCLLPGLSKSTDFVGKSKEAFDILCPKIKAAIDSGEGAWINILCE